MALAFSTVGAVVASRRPESPIGWIFCAIGVLSGFRGLSVQYAIYAYVLGLGSLARWRSSRSDLPLELGALRCPAGTPRYVVSRRSPTRQALVVLRMAHGNRSLVRDRRFGGLRRAVEEC